MTGIVSEESGVGKSVEGMSSGQRYHSGEALAEWRSSEQVENGVTSTSPPYWDAGDEDDCGMKPSELYGKYTWKIEKFSQITKRELRSNAFEVAGYKWYILIYPQGCDVCNHLSLFLCVANHDKLLPGWSHFAQFTIAVVNKDPKKSKYSDTLHRFWKKEHDWGWKKFMELSKVYDGFVDTSDNLIIKAQVQIIREKSDRPFRGLDYQYRRELVRVYLTNVEQICRRFVEERRSKLGKLIEDKARWSSFFAFWREIDQTSRHSMSMEKTDVILKIVVKHFFIEKEVTSTLVMDSLYSGLKALEGQPKCKKSRVKMSDAEEMPAPIVRVENDMFVLVEDVLLLLERAATEPLPPKDEKGPQSRTKDGNSGEDFNKDSIECDERRLTELGRRTLEIFVLAHVFSNKIEIAYQEAVALKKQEELIREEEAAWQAESDQKAKRGVNDREKKSKKKQAKQKRNNRKGKDKAREERTTVAVHDKNHEANAVDEKKNINMEEARTLSEKPDATEEAQTLSEKPDVMKDVSDVSDSADGVSVVLQPDSEDRDAIPVNWDIDAPEIHSPTEASNNGIVVVSSLQNGMSEKRISSAIDDSSSTCSTDSLPSVFMNDPYNGNSFSNYKFQKSPNRRKNRGKAPCDVGCWTNEIGSQPSGSAAKAGDNNDDSVTEGAALSLQDRLKWAEQHVVRKEEGALLSLQKEHSIKDHIKIEGPVDNESLQKEKISTLPSSPISSPTSLSSSVQMKLEHKTTATVNPVHVKKTSLSVSLLTDKDASALSDSTSQVTTLSKSEIHETSTAKLTDRSVSLSRPASAPLVPGPRPTAPVVSMFQTAPQLARSVSAAGRLGPDPLPATHSHVPRSYKNAMIGNPVTSRSASLSYSSSSSSGINSSLSYSQPSSMVPSPIFLPQSSDRMNSNAGQSGVPFGISSYDNLQNGPQWMESSQREASRRMHYDQPSRINDVLNHDLYRPLHSRSMGNMSTEFPACTSGRQNQGFLVDEFPHLDIINDLLDDEHVIGKTQVASSLFQPLDRRAQLLNRQSTCPGDLGADDNLGSSASSCRFERSRSYHHDHRFQGGYSSSSSGHFDSPRVYIPRTSTVPYVNGQVDGSVPNQWQVAGSDLSYLGMRNSENGGYSYYPDYSNMAGGVNGYSVFRSSNGPYRER
ncbi:PREDICTED: MATH domain-containing protein At5g43560-like [Lupinus angustifolius]|uniref:MATH domain-containing protein At5g43560-like n=1 Tax=Lupinus angustifolius TaxID=3871 RepID=UPI00092FB648|nr:PREDICTED: MATH domain-containing protein At5g43560-like [Lupinus angustifolius]XP_019461141.1 PREDICTED: MATH domain-containing protein At5g43560-like [Lupinus angustifolius]XP_019461142.1 PREDICTED: MATH domain-containing protein At5g43560-like [Lupinus angustifolius]